MGRWAKTRHKFVITQTDGVTICVNGYEVAYVCVTPGARRVRQTIWLTGSNKKVVTFRPSPFGYGMNLHYVSRKTIQLSDDTALNCSGMRYMKTDQEFWFRIESKCDFTIWHYQGVHLNVRTASGEFRQS